MEWIPLAVELHKHLNWNLARINFLAQFLVAMFKTKSSNLADIATGFSGKSLISSNYERIRAFFRHYLFSQEDIAKIIVLFFDLPKDDWHLVIDRTNWKFGSLNINILVLGILYNGVMFPLFHTFLEKRGNSNEPERIALMLRFIHCFGRPNFLHIAADREFIGRVWFKFLRKNNIDFCIRVRDNTLIPNQRGRLRNAKVLFRNLPLQVYENLGVRKIWDQYLFVVGGKNATGEYVILLCTKNPDSARQVYAQRWGH